MNKNEIIIAMILVCLLPLVSSVTNQNLGTVPVGKDLELIQICSNSTSLCDYCNITSVTFISNATTIISNKAMTKRQSDFNYTLSGTNISAIGSYLVNGYCGAGSEVEVWSYTFTVTQSGQEKPNTGEGLSLIGLFVVIIIVSGFFLIMAWMSNNQIVKSMFIGLSAFIMAVVVFFGMTTITQILGGYSNLVKGYNTFFFFILLCIVIAVFATLVIVLIKSMYAMKIKSGALDPDNFQLEGRMQ